MGITRCVSQVERQLILLSVFDTYTDENSVESSCAIFSDSDYVGNQPLGTMVALRSGCWMTGIADVPDIGELISAISTFKP